MPLDAGIIERSIGELNPVNQLQKMQALKTMQLQQQDIGSQIQERNAIAAQRNAETQQGTAAAQVMQDHFASQVAAGKPIDFDDPELTKKLYAVAPKFADTYSTTRAKVNADKATAENQKGDLAVKQGQAAETVKKNLFEQRKEQAETDRKAADEARKNAEEAAGTLITGSEFTTPDANGKPSRAAQFRVRQSDGTYKNETRILGQEIAAPQNPPQEQPPLSAGRFQQEQILAQQKENAARQGRLDAAGNDERLAGVPVAQHSKVYSDVQKAEDAHTAAQGATDTINTFINQAKGGNKEAYAYSPVAGVLEINTGAGIKRINRQEIEQYGGAGSLFDRIQGAVGKQVSGASISPSVLNDMKSLHDELGRNTDMTYQRSLQSIDRTYRSHFSGQSAPASIPINPATRKPYAVGDTINGRKIKEINNKGPVYE